MWRRMSIYPTTLLIETIIWTTTHFFLTHSCKLKIFFLRLLSSSRKMSSSLLTIRNRFQVPHMYVRDVVKICNYNVLAKERTCWKLTNPMRHFWNCRNSMVILDLATFIKAIDFSVLNSYFTVKNPFISKQILNLYFVDSVY